MEDVQRPAHILGPVLAAIDKDVVGAQLGDIAHGARHGDAAGLGHGLDALGEVHAVAEQVVVVLVDDDLAQMHADTEPQLLLLVEVPVEARHALLDVDRRLDRRQRRAELDQHGIAVAVDERAAGRVDGRPPDLAARRLEMLVGEVLPALCQAHEARQVGMEDGGKPALRGCHGVDRRHGYANRS